MTDPELVPDLPLVPQLMGGVVGQAAVAVAAVPVVLREDRGADRLLASLAFVAVAWCVWTLVVRTFFRRPVIRERVRRVAGPVRPDPRRLRVQIGRRVILGVAIFTVTGSLLSALGSLVVLPGLLLGLAGFELLSIHDLRRWQADQGAVLFTETGSSPWARPAGPRDPDQLLAVTTPALATTGDRS